MRKEYDFSKGERGKYFRPNAMAGYVDELVEVRELLNNRYDDLKSGRVKALPGDEVEAHFREKSAAARRPSPVYDRICFPSRSPLSRRRGAGRERSQAPKDGCVRRPACYFPLAPQSPLW